MNPKRDQLFNCCFGFKEPLALIHISDYEALQAECEKLRKDAERYRWLRSQSSPATVMLFGVDEGLALDGMDEAIDAAIAQDVEIFEAMAQQEPGNGKREDEK